MINKLVEISKEAGEAILGYYNDDIEVDYKSDDSPLTKADLAAHHLIVDALNELAPEIPVISEESGIPDYNTRKAWKQFFLVDPLDGTKEFIKKNGEFTVNIALIEGDTPLWAWFTYRQKVLPISGVKEWAVLKVPMVLSPHRLNTTFLIKRIPLPLW
ncbi:MAG: inositol monophosphatase family protein [Balneolales bacterium]